MSHNVDICLLGILDFIGQSFRTLWKTSWSTEYRSSYFDLKLILNFSIQVMCISHQYKFSEKKKETVTFLLLTAKVSCQGSLDGTGASSSIFLFRTLLGTVSYTTVLCIITQHSSPIPRDVAKLRLTADFKAGLSEAFEVDS